MINRVGLARVARQVSSRRVSLACGARGRSLLRRSYSASSGGQRSGNGGNVLPSLLGAAAALSAIYFVYPFEKKPKQEAKAEAEAVQEAQDEPATEPETAAQEPADEAEQQPDESDTEEPANQAEKPDEGSSEQSETISEGPADSEPTKDNTVSSSGSEESGKDLKSDEEIQKVEEAQLEPTNQEAEQEGAYNPDTGEINWDCPCLGGMAHGPCGEEFKLAFSCFVFSEAEPKGIDCVEKFQGMQECFRKYPDYYAEQIKDEEEAVAVRDDKIAAATTGEEAKQGTETEAGSGNPDGKQGETVTEQPQDNKSSGAPAEQDMKAVSDE